jgi:hypothetical protein
MVKKAQARAKPNPAIRLSNLRSRFVQLFAAEEPDAAYLQAELQRLTDGLKPASFLPLLAGAYADIPKAGRAALDAPIREWLQTQGLLAQLRDLEERQAITGAGQPIARAWLEASGITPAPLPSDANLADLLIASYEVANPMQASTVIFWYADGRRRLVRSVTFLIDYQPPWEGSLKDVAYHEARDFEKALNSYQRLWREHGLEAERIGLPAAAQQIWAALHQSWSQQIRLPIDFSARFGDVVPLLLALPTPPDTPTLTVEELGDLALNGRSPEDLWDEEKALGYQTRMDDGSIIRIMRPHGGEY